MEQTMSKYRCESPYRSAYRNNETTEKITKYWAKFIRQTIISGFILAILLCCKNVDAISNSEAWEKGAAIAQANLTLEQIKNGLEWSVEYAKITIPEILNKQVKKETQTTEISTNISPVTETIIPEVDFSNMTEEEIDIHNILSATTVLRPVGGDITSPFGERTDPITQKDNLHTGTDFVAAIGTQIKSAISGTVVEIGTGTVSYGNYVKIKNSDIITLYAHCSSIKVKEGDKVTQGEIIALSGNTGKTSGPHLHFEIMKAGRLIDPEKVMTW